MPSAVHIAGDTEPDIAIRVHTKNFNIVLLIKITVVHVFLLRKTKHTCHTACINLIGPQLILLHKCSHLTLFVNRKLNVLRSHTQINALRIDHRSLCTENFIGRSGKIKQEHTGIRIAQTIKFLYIVKLRHSFGIDRGDPVVQHEGCGRPIDIHKAWRRLVKDLRIQTAPHQAID